MTVITGERFTKIGEALFGPTKWYPVLARMIGKDRTMVWRMATGRVNVRPEMREKLAIICRARADALMRLADDLHPNPKMQQPVSRFAAGNEIALDEETQITR